MQLPRKRVSKTGSFLHVWRFKKQKQKQKTTNLLVRLVVILDFLQALVHARQMEFADEPFENSQKRDHKALALD
jgi:hypothetical protein